MSVRAEIPRAEITRLLSPEEVADALGLEVVTIRRLLRDEDLPGVKLGGRWVVSEVVLRDWLRKKGLLPSTRPDVDDPTESPTA